MGTTGRNIFIPENPVGKASQEKKHPRR